MRLVNNSRYIQTMGFVPGTPEWDADMAAKAKAQLEAQGKLKDILGVPQPVAIGIGIGGLLLIGLGVWFFFFRKK